MWPWIIAAAIAVHLVFVYRRHRLRTARAIRALPDSVRPHHYLFVQELRNCLSRRPVDFVGHFAQPEPLLKLWGMVGKDVAQHGAAMLPPDGLSGQIAQVSNRIGALITLPTPQAPTESYYVLGIIDHAINKGPPIRILAKGLLYTLEMPPNAAPDQAILCRWDGNRRNIVEQCTIRSPEQFVQAVARCLPAA